MVLCIFILVATPWGRGQIVGEVLWEREPPEAQGMLGAAEQGSQETALLAFQEFYNSSFYYV